MLTITIVMFAAAALLALAANKKSRTRADSPGEWRKASACSGRWG